MTARRYFALCATAIGFALGYALPVYARLPRPFYDPLHRRWFWAVQAAALPMGYVGQVLWALAVALGLGAVTYAATAARREAPSEREWALGAAWALTALLVVLGYFAWNNWP